MPLPTPNPNEEERAFISRCMGNPTMVSDYKDTKQRVAVCYSQWRNKKDEKAEKQDEYPCMPEGEEEEGEFMSRCMLDSAMRSDYPKEEERAAACGQAWLGAQGEEPPADETPPEEPPAEAEDACKPKPKKAEGSSSNRTMQFLVSNEDPDRDGDVVVQSGWDLTAFKENPVFLVAHDKTKFPVGTFIDLSVQGKSLVGTVKFADPGTYDLADLAYDLYSQGILKGCSVGFRPVKPIEDNVETNDKGGFTYKKQELLEVSAVSVPANPKALAIAKSYKKDISSLLISKEEISPIAKDVERDETKVKLEEAKANKEKIDKLTDAIKELNTKLKR